MLSLKFSFLKVEVFVLQSCAVMYRSGLDLLLSYVDVRVFISDNSVNSEHRLSIFAI